MVYADINATTPLKGSVKEYLATRLTKGPLANPNALHSLGCQVRQGMESCREVCGRVLDVHPSQVIFNSGASEGITTVFHHFLYQGPATRDVLLVGSLEHEAVLASAGFYQKIGFEVVSLPATKEGIISAPVLQENLKKFSGRVALVALMAANNETGVIQPYSDYGALCRDHEVPLLADTCQLIGKTDFSFIQSDLDFAVVSGHKLGALPGSGCLLVKNPLTLTPLIFGAKQESGLRGGTQNYIGNETLAVALEDFEKHRDQLAVLEQARLSFESELRQRFPEVIIAGENEKRLPNTTLVAYPGLHGQAVQIELESRDIYVTTSSACSDNEPRTSGVLQAMGIDDETGRGMIRISLGLEKFAGNYDQILEALTKSYQHLLRIGSY